MARTNALWLLFLCDLWDTCASSWFQSLNWAHRNLHRRMCHSEGQAEASNTSDVSIFRWFMSGDRQSYFIVAAAIWWGQMWNQADLQGYISFRLASLWLWIPSSHWYPPCPVTLSRSMDTSRPQRNGPQSHVWVGNYRKWRRGMRHKYLSSKLSSCTVDSALSAKQI